MQSPPGNNIHSSLTLWLLLPFSLYAWSKIVHLYLNKHRRQSTALVSMSTLQFWWLSLPREYDLLHIKYNLTGSWVTVAFILSACLLLFCTLFELSRVLAEHFSPWHATPHPLQGWSRDSVNKGFQFLTRQMLILVLPKHSLDFVPIMFLDATSIFQFRFGFRES